jgi:hypothetical protein
MYLNGFFRAKPSSEEDFECVGDAETHDFLTNPDCDEALRAASSLAVPWDDEAQAWFDGVEQESLQVAMEQCCHAGRLLPVEERALRLQRFTHLDQQRAEHMIDRLPLKSGSSALDLVCWWVRIERAKRTGSPDMDPKRSLRSR